jgi:cGMP-dependent protein kinase
LALLYNAPRSATIKSIGKCELWGIDRETFKKVVQEMAVNEYKENREYIEKIDFFENFNEE